MSAASAGATAAGVAAGKARSFFSAAWNATKGVASGAKDVGVNAAKGVGHSFNAADKFVNAEIAANDGSFTKAVNKMASEHKVTATALGVAGTYAAYKGVKAVVGPATERLKREREARSAERDR